jgi:transglutaminase-like putative cysteine protease
MIYHVSHETRYEYADLVSTSHNLLHLAARTCPCQTRLRQHLEYNLPPAVEVTRPDYFGNPTTFLTIQEPHREFVILAFNVVNVHPLPLPDPQATMPWEDVARFLRTDRSESTLDAYQFAFDSAYVSGSAELAAYAAPSFPPGRPVLEALMDLTRRIQSEFRYDPEATTTATPLSEVLDLRHGVCQDFAHLQIGCLRSLGLAARYVSGYLLTTPPPGKEKLVGADASHAWVSLYVPGHGWVDTDPTNNLMPREHHIVLAWGRDYDDVSPIKGVILGGGEHQVTVAVDVTPQASAGQTSG